MAQLLINDTSYSVSDDMIGEVAARVVEALRKAHEQGFWALKMGNGEDGDRVVMVTLSTQFTIVGPGGLFSDLAEGGVDDGGTDPR